MIKDFILSVPLIVSTLSAANAQIQAIDVAAAKKEGILVWPDACLFWDRWRKNNLTEQT